MRTSARPSSRSANSRGARTLPSRGESAREDGGAPTVKLQKRLAEAGLGSRRAMEELIQSGQVSVNGRTARLGARVAPSDRIAVDGEPLPQARMQRAMREPRVVLYHKPEGEIVSRRDPAGRPSVFDRVAVVQRGRWLAVGRLDFNTCGLLIFTDSGELANRLTHPRFEQPRDYAVRVVGELSEEQVRRLRSGVELDDGPARFELLEPQGGEGTNRWYRVRVSEGRNRLVRRLFASQGVTVSRLMRTRFGPFELPPRLKRGQWLRLEPDEVKQVLRRLEETKERGPRGRGARTGRVGSRQPREHEPRGRQEGRAGRHERSGEDMPRAGRYEPRSGGDMPRARRHEPRFGGDKLRAARHEPGSRGDEPRAARNQLRAGNQARAGRSEPRSGGDQPRAARNQLRAGNQPRVGRHEPRSGGDQPRAARNQLRARNQLHTDTGDPRAAGNQPHAGRQDSRADRREPRAGRQEPRSRPSGVRSAPRAEARSGAAAGPHRPPRRFRAK